MEISKEQLNRIADGLLAKAEALDAVEFHKPLLAADGYLLINYKDFCTVSAARGYIRGVAEGLKAQSK